MKPIQKIFPFCALLAFTLGCENETTPSLFDPNATGNPAPTIASIAPALSALAGVDLLTITGSNFSANKSDNFVYFNDLLAEVVQASTTELKVKAPILVKDSIKVRIAVFKAERFSNIMLYKLEAAVVEPIAFKSFEQPWGITCDADGNVYFSLVSSEVGVGVKKMTPAGSLSDYSPKPPGIPTRYSSLKFGPGGFLYGATLERRLLQIPAGGGAAITWVAIPNPPGALLNFYDLDFDAAKNIWAAGNNEFIYRIKPDKSFKDFPFKANVRSVRVYNDYVYLAGNRDGAEKVWRLRLISADEVGPEEEYFNFATINPPAGAGIYAMTFAADGDMYIGADAPAAFYVVHPNKSVEPFYPGLFVPKTLFFAWGKNTELYVVREKAGSAAQTMIRVNMRKNSAPYYGRQ